MSNHVHNAIVFLDSSSRTTQVSRHQNHSQSISYHSTNISWSLPSIWYDPFHHPPLIPGLACPYPQPSSKCQFSRSFCLTPHPQKLCILHPVFVILNTCQCHLNLFCCSAVSLSSVPLVCLSVTLGVFGVGGLVSPMYATDRRQTASSLNAPSIGGGHNNNL